MASHKHLPQRLRTQRFQADLVKRSGSVKLPMRVEMFPTRSDVSRSHPIGIVPIMAVHASKLRLGRSIGTCAVSTLGTRPRCPAWIDPDHGDVFTFSLVCHKVDQLVECPATQHPIESLGASDTLSVGLFNLITTVSLMYMNTVAARMCEKQKKRLKPKNASSPA